MHLHDDALGEVFHLDTACSVGLFFYAYLDGISWQYVFNQFRPFNEAESTTVEIVLISHIIHFVNFLDTIKVEMIY